MPYEFPLHQTLRTHLITGGRTRWLDIGCGGNFERGFHTVDVFPERLIPFWHRRGYTRLDLLEATDEQLARLGSYDLIRMQHVLEHFTWEEAAVVLEKCATLLNRDGVLVVTVPDLRIHINRYLKSEYRDSGYAGWAEQRIPRDAPDSYYFSLFAHSMTYEPHKWCYDAEGLLFLLSTVSGLKECRVLPRDSLLASVPFTHNRPDEDLCVIAMAGDAGRG